MGHLKKGHIRKQLIINCIASLVFFFLASRMVSWDYLYQSFGFFSTPLYAGLFLIAIVWHPVGYFLSPLSMAISRKFEVEADGHVYTAIQTTKPLISALRKMALDNLSNLHPHPLYVRFNYSHPPLLERIKSLERIAGYAGEEST
jgi:STE24 endopeptidase